MVVVLGAAFKHKNRQYALRLCQLASEIIQRSVEVLVIGPEPHDGSSEQEDLSLAKELQGQVDIRFYPWVTDQELKTVLSRSRVVLYPSLSEGFGLVPFEAAASGSAPLFPARCSLRETLGSAPFVLSLTKVEDDAELLAHLLTSDSAVQQQVNFVNRASKGYTWESVAERTYQSLLLTSLLPPRVDPEIRDRLFANADARHRRSVKVRSSRVVATLLPVGSRRRRPFAALAHRIGW